VIPIPNICNYFYMDLAMQYFTSFMLPDLVNYITFCTFYIFNGILNFTGLGSGTNNSVVCICAWSTSLAPCIFKSQQTMLFYLFKNTAEIYKQITILIVHQVTFRVSMTLILLVLLSVSNSWYLLHIPSLVLQLFQFHLLHCSDYLHDDVSDHITMEILLTFHAKKMLHILRQTIVYASLVLHDWDFPCLKVWHFL